MEVIIKQRLKDLIQKSPTKQKLRLCPEMHHHYCKCTPATRIILCVILSEYLTCIQSLNLIRSNQRLVKKIQPAVYIQPLHGWDSVKHWILNGAKSHSKLMSTSFLFSWQKSESWNPPRAGTVPSTPLGCPCEFVNKSRLLQPVLKCKRRLSCKAWKSLTQFLKMSQQ